MSRKTFVVVGAGLAGAMAAAELRERGFDGRILLLGSEPERPYQRPPLSKDYLRGESARERAYVHPEAFYPEQGIDLETGTRVTALHPRESRVTLDDGREMRYDRLLLCTGAEPRPIPVPGAALDGVCYLRTLADCDELRERLTASSRVVVIGAGGASVSPWCGACDRLVSGEATYPIGSIS